MMDERIEDGLWGSTLPSEVLETLRERKIIHCYGKRLDALWYGECKRWRSRRKAIRRVCAANARKEREYEERFGLGPWPKDMREREREGGCDEKP